MTAGYAAKTKVDPNRTREEIVTLLRKAGATKVAPMSDYETGQEILLVELPTRRLRFAIRMPLPTDEAVVYYDEPPGPSGKPRKRPVNLAQVMLQQITRTKWRKLHLYIKAKLDAVAEGTATIEDEFLAQTVMPNGQTVGEWARGQIDVAYLERRMPPMLPGGDR